LNLHADINKIGRSTFSIEHVMGYFSAHSKLIGKPTNAQKWKLQLSAAEGCAQPYHQQLHIIDASAQMHFPPTQLHFLTISTASARGPYAESTESTCAAMKGKFNPQKSLHADNGQLWKCTRHA
jgi:hypothetical protein